MPHAIVPVHVPPDLQSVFIAQASVQVPEMQLKPAAQSPDVTHGPDFIVPMGTSQMGGNALPVASQPTSHLKPVPHADAPAAVMSEQSFAQ